MEGPLSKWTNVMKGWQYRWFVLDQNSGQLSYYTSKNNMMRGDRRGCVKLKGAVIGIDDEDDSTFTVTSADMKTFHFQARDFDEREKWIDALEEAILRHSQPLKKWEKSLGVSPADFDKKLAETDAYLQLLIDQVKNLEERINQCEDMQAREQYNVIKITAESMIESIKHSIVMIQMAKQNALAAMSSNGPSAEPIVADSTSVQSLDIEEAMLTAESSETSGLAPPSGPNDVPEVSYSSSEDEFFDADDEENSGASPSKQKHKTNKKVVEDSPEEPKTPPVVIASEDDYYDDLYDDMEEDDLGSLSEHGSIISHLLSQVRLGMDLTKIVLPTFILEKRSLLEMFSDFLAHPDLFCNIADAPTPRERMIETVRWYLSAFHAGRRSDIAKKPYNPILGETFRCCFDVPGSPACQEKNEDGPIPWATKENVSFIGEQVSHHPPISAFYAEHYNKKISIDGYIWTKSKFLGLSIAVHMIGQAVISVIDHDEEYIVTFPSGYGRSILTVPWVELGGKVNISCAKTGYSANIEFLCKPFYGGKKARLTGEIFSPTEKKPICQIQGEWNGVMYAKYDTGMSESFVDTKTMPIHKKKVKPIEQQTEFESRRLWQEVTKNLKVKNVEAATDGKRKLEHRQREEAKERKEKDEKWETKHFHERGEHWAYGKPLLKRLAQAKEQTKPNQDTSVTPE
ncbi:unnamed protein product [Owenia fusiformis]|uniref:Oxysterol-binding protein n=1 Tax=Owenia fusiformis TaxID=6347 RepID=A0A8J1U9I7_OWEFU|nr:unnamed protein product [Owenia fusiformis]